MKNKIFYIFYIFSVSLYAKTVTLSEVYELALINSKDILEGKYTLEAKKENINQTKSALYPQISLNASYSDTKRVLNSLQSHSSYIEEETSMDYYISLNQSIYNAEIYSKISLENQENKINKISFELKKQELLKDVLKIYIDILKQKNKISFAQNDLKFKEYSYSLTQKKYEKKLASKIDLIESKIEYAKSKNSLKKEKGLLKVQKHLIQRFVGVENYDFAKINYKKVSYSTILNMKSEINNDFAYLNSLKIQEAKFGETYAKKEVSYAKSAYYPTISFDFKYTKYNSEDLSSDYESVNRGAIVLHYPLFQGGSTSSSVLSAKLKLQAAKVKLSNVEEQNKATVDESRVIFDSLIEEYKIYDESLKAASLNYEKNQIEYEKGLKSIIDLYESKSKTSKIKYEYSDVLFKLIESYTSLLIATNSFDKLYLLDKLFVK